jgi:hypothetical protein
VAATRMAVSPKVNVSLATRMALPPAFYVLKIARFACLVRPIKNPCKPTADAKIQWLRLGFPAIRGIGPPGDHVFWPV